MKTAAQFTNTKEFHELRNDFEKVFSDLKLDRENKELYRIGRFYQNGETNNAFRAFLHGYQVGRVNYMN